MDVSSLKNLLVIEDNIGDARLVKEILRDTEYDNYELTFVHDLDELKEFSKSKFQVILLDLHISDIEPTTTFNRVNRLFQSTPIIILTGLKDDELAAKIVRQGAQDYLVKGTFDSDTLQRSIKYAIYRKASEKRLAKQKITSRRFKDRADNFESESIRLTSINKSKDVFLSIASHQLRTPASVVKQYIGLFLDGFAGEIDDKQKKYLKTAFDSNERQLQIINDLLRVAKLDAGHVTLRRVPVDLVSLMQNILEDHNVILSTRKHTVEFSHDETKVVANIDENNIRMVFENLLDNANKYSDEGALVRVEVEQKGRWVFVRVIDSGIGITKEDQAKLFQKFSRIDDSFTYAPNGSGLGLYWAKEIVKLHGGDIHLESIKGTGSTFEIKLPH